MSFKSKRYCTTRKTREQRNRKKHRSPAGYLGSNTSSEPWWQSPKDEAILPSGLGGTRMSRLSTPVALTTILAAAGACKIMRRLP